MLYLHDEDADILHELEAPSPSAQGFAEGITYKGLSLTWGDTNNTGTGTFYVTFTLPTAPIANTYLTFDA